MRQIYNFFIQSVILLHAEKVYIFLYIVIPRRTKMSYTHIGF